MDDKSDEVLTIDELSPYLKISKSILYELVREGKIPGQKVGRHWRFLKVAIDCGLENRSAATSAQAGTPSSARGNYQASVDTTNWPDHRFGYTEDLPDLSVPRKRGAGR